MTHLSRPDNDKMFSDMALENGSADYDSKSDYEEYDDDELSGSGDSRKFDILIFLLLLIFICKNIFHFTALETPRIDAETTIPINIPKPQNPNAGSSLRISFTLSTLITVLLPSYIVILFKF